MVSMYEYFTSSCFIHVTWVTAKIYLWLHIWLVIQFSSVYISNNFYHKYEHCRKKTINTDGRGVSRKHEDGNGENGISNINKLMTVR